MNREDIIRMAREAGCSPFDFGVTLAHVKDLGRFAALVAAAEREALQSLETDAHFIFNNPPSECSQEVRDVIEWYASSIRARGETK